MLRYYFYSMSEETVFKRRFKRDRSIRALQDGEVRSGHLVSDIHSAALATAQRLAFKQGVRTAKVIVREDGPATNGGLIFFAEVWTRGYKRHIDDVWFALRGEDS